jgi:hypothetical protein
VRPFREDSGDAGMVARELPPDEVLASSLDHLVIGQGADGLAQRFMLLGQGERGESTLMARS